MTLTNVSFIISSSCENNSAWKRLIQIQHLVHF